MYLSRARKWGEMRWEVSSTDRAQILNRTLMLCVLSGSASLGSESVQDMLSTDEAKAPAVGSKSGEPVPRAESSLQRLVEVAAESLERFTPPTFRNDHVNGILCNNVCRACQAGEFLIIYSTTMCASMRLVGADEKSAPSSI